jgi:O-antigen ligase
MILETTAAPDSEIRSARANSGRRIAIVLQRVIFFTLLCLIPLTAIPYGSAQQWWKAAFVCVVFTLAILWLIEGSISGRWFGDTWSIALPTFALSVFALLQTVPLGNRNNLPGGITISPWYAISADPYQTRFFALQLLALTVTGVLLANYGFSKSRLRITINVVIGVALASAVFGILRQTTQHSPGFGLPLLVTDSGYAQFINYNHFAYLMEMSLGLILGLVLGGGVRREQTLIYVAALLPIWIGLVLCGSRGGLIAMLAQLIAASVLFGVRARKASSREGQSKVLRTINWGPFRGALVLVLIAGVVFGTVWLGGDRLAVRVEQTRTEFARDETRVGVSRNDVWKASWRLFVAHPILGVGMGGYWAVIPQFHNASGTMTPQEAHNDYLELLASGGLVGLALLMWFAVVVCKRTLENLRAPNRFRRAACYGAAVGLTGVAVHSLVDFGLHTIVNALTFTTLIVIATSKPHWGNEPTRVL